MKEWKYLESKSFQERYIFAAKYLKNCKNILEVGGYKTPITNFLQGNHKSVTVVDPLIDPYSNNKLNGKPCITKHLPIKIQDYKLKGDEDGFIALGLDLYGENDKETLVNIMKKCKISVIEIPIDHLPSLKLLNNILKTKLFKVKLKKVFDFSDNDFGDLSDSYPPFTNRNLYILAPKEKSIQNSEDLELSKYIKSNKKYIKKLSRKIRFKNITDIEKNIGLIGLSSQKYSLKLYHKLKRLKEKELIKRAERTNKKNLINKEYMNKVILTNSSYSETHGAKKNYMGLGMLYYSIVHIFRPKVCVCIGSGGGYVPRIMRQGQYDLEIAKKSKTILIDANMPEVGYGEPDYMHEDSYFRKLFPEIEIINRTSKDAIKILKFRKIKIDYLHIDGDHSYKGSLTDYELYRPLMNKQFIITMHDTRAYHGVAKTIDKIRKNKDIELIDFNYLWAGLALIKPINAPKTELFSTNLNTNLPGLGINEKEINKELSKK